MCVGTLRSFPGAAMLAVEDMWYSRAEAVRTSARNRLRNILHSAVAVVFPRQGPQSSGSRVDLGSQWHELQNEDPQFER